MKTVRNLQIIFVLVFGSGWLFACNAIHEPSRFPGVTYISPLGNLPANTLVWSRNDSTKILVSAISFMRHDAKVYILDVASKKKTMLVNTDHGDVWGNAWSPNGNQIALSVIGGTKGFSRGGLWVMNVENNSMENYSEKYGAVAWLPDGKTLAFLTSDLASGQNSQRLLIYLIDVQTKESELIYSNLEASAFQYSGISSSPDGQYLVFSLSSEDSGASGLYILDIRTGSINQLSQGDTDAFPQWSSIGDLITYNKKYTIDNKTVYSIHIVLPGGGCDLEVPNLNYALSPTWSPDGRKIAFIGEDGIYVLDTDIVFGRDIYHDLCP